jgi:hypothetical protein
VACRRRRSPGASPTSSLSGTAVLICCRPACMVRGFPAWQVVCPASQVAPQYPTFCHLAPPPPLTGAGVATFLHVTWVGRGGAGTGAVGRSGHVEGRTVAARLPTRHETHRQASSFRRSAGWTPVTLMSPRTPGGASWGNPGHSDPQDRCASPVRPERPASATRRSSLEPALTSVDTARRGVAVTIGDPRRRPPLADCERGQ